MAPSHSGTHYQEIGLCAHVCTHVCTHVCQYVCEAAGSKDQQEELIISAWSYLMPWFLVVNTSGQGKGS